MILFSFFNVFVYDINYLYYSNIVYYLLLLKQIVNKNGKLNFINNLPAILFFLLFVVWATISSLIYMIEFQDMQFRSLIQLLFTFQYFVLIIDYNFDFDLFERLTYYFSIILSIFIVFIFSYMLISKNINVFSFKDTQIAIKYIPGWPNTTPIPLLMSLWIAFKNKNSYFSISLLIMALIITTSRGAYLGLALILMYFLFKEAKKNLLIQCIITLIIVGTVIITSYILLSNPFYKLYFIRAYDRVDILKTTFAYLKLTPLLGYGGNTLAQLKNISIDYTPILQLSHTHNWILEILLRYGIIGFTLFFGFITSIFIKIREKDKKYMFFVLLTLALFQTFIRDFVFIFYLVYLSRASKDLI